MRRSRPPKIQRWMDLVAALLSRRFSVTFEELSPDVPAYADAPSVGARMRMFERDKEELRAFGVPIETVISEDGEPPGYLLRRRDFYLPFIIVRRSGAERGSVRPGYRDLPRVLIEPDELAALDDAALCARLLGDPVLARNAEAAIRKVAFDLPRGALASAEPAAVATGRAQTNARTFELLDRALWSRKRVSFTYRASRGTAPERREVEPYGLFVRGGDWYLAARDVARGTIRDFRVDRMSDVEVNGRREHSPDFEIPAGFDLKEHARLRWPWELGDDEPFEALVRFRVANARSGAASAAQLGVRVEDDEGARRFRVRRLTPFVHWLMSFGGDAIPLDPPELVSSFRAAVRETLSRYEASSVRLPSPGGLPGYPRAVRGPGGRGRTRGRPRRGLGQRD